MAAPTLETNAGATILRVTGGTSGDPVTFDDIWNWDDGGGSSAGDGDVPKDGGGTAKVNTFMTEVTKDVIYTVDADIQWGNSSTATAFQSKSEMVTFANLPGCTSNAVVVIGAPSNSVYSTQGSKWRFPGHNFTTSFPSLGSLEIYGSVIELVDDYWNLFDSSGSGGHLKIYQSVFTLGGFQMSIRQACTAFDVDGMHVDGGELTLRIVPDSSNNIAIENGVTRGFLVTSISGAEVSTKNLLVTNYDSNDVYVTDAKATLKDPLFHIASPQNATAADWIREQYTCNVHMADSTGADLPGVTVQCQTFGNVVSNDSGSTFYKCIIDHTAGTFATDVSNGKWELTTAAFAALAGCDGTDRKGAWVTGVDYTAAASAFSVATGANGDITEQNVDYKKWVLTSEALLTFTPHTFTLTYGGDTQVINDFVVDSPIKWYMEFPPVATLLGEVINRLKRIGPTNEV